MPPADSADGTQWVVFCLDSGRYAVALSSVERIVRAVELTRLPSAPPDVMGVIDVQGRMLPVMNVRRRFGLLERHIEPSDQFLIARITHRTAVLPIDAALGVLQCPVPEAIKSENIGMELQHIRGVIRLPDGMVLIHDLDLFLSAEGSRALDEALNQGMPDAG